MPLPTELEHAAPLELIPSSGANLGNDSALLGVLTDGLHCLQLALEQLRLVRLGAHLDELLNLQALFLCCVCFLVIGEPG